MTQTILITGAARGIGKSLTELYLSRGDSVIAVCRQNNGVLSGDNLEIIEGVDVTSQADIDALAARLGDRRIDVLINNAGLLRNETLDAMDFDSVDEQFQVNTMGPLRITHALLGNLGEGSRIVMMTSQMGSVSDNGMGAYYGYRISKCALNAASMSLAIDLKPRGVSVAIIHPGYVQTDMTGGSGNIDAGTSARQISERVDELNLDNSGTFWHSNGSVLQW